VRLTARCSGRGSRRDGSRQAGQAGQIDAGPAGPTAHARPVPKEHDGRGDGGYVIWWRAVQFVPALMIALQMMPL
jgi:hypothetical protein